MKLSRSKLGKKKGMTRNQKRKAAYAAKAAEDAKHRRDAGLVGKHLVKKKKVRLVGSRMGHRSGLPIDCPNIGCRRCNPSGR